MPRAPRQGRLAPSARAHKHTCSRTYTHAQCIVARLCFTCAHIKVRARAGAAHSHTCSSHVQEAIRELERGLLRACSLSLPLFSQNPALVPARSLRATCAYTSTRVHQAICEIFFVIICNEFIYIIHTIIL